jgi:hypothetical protein
VSILVERLFDMLDGESMHIASTVLLNVLALTIVYGTSTPASAHEGADLAGELLHSAVNHWQLGVKGRGHGRRDH